MDGIVLVDSLDDVPQLLVRVLHLTQHPTALLLQDLQLRREGGREEVRLTGSLQIKHTDLIWCVDNSVEA